MNEGEHLEDMVSKPMIELDTNIMD